MTTRLQLRDKVRYVLGGDIAQVNFTDDVLNASIDAALDALLPWVSKASVAEFVGDGVLDSFQLPADLYRVTAVFDSESGIYLPQNSLMALSSPGSNIETNQDWIEYPEGYLTFSRFIEVEETITLYYGAMWEKPNDDTDVIEAPEYCLNALIYFAASHALLEKATQASNVRQWNIDVDSGTPTMNPMRDMSTYFMDRFRIEADRLPSRTRGTR